MWEAIWQWVAGLDWRSFVPQLLGALVAAGVGFLGVVWAFRAQRRASYDETVDNAIGRVVEEISLRAAAITRYRHELKVFEFKAVGALVGHSANPEPVLKPNDFALDMAIDIAEMRSRDADQKMIGEIRHAFLAIRESELDRQLEGLGLLGGAISRWRSRIWDEQRVRESLAQVQEVANRQ